MRGRRGGQFLLKSKAGNVADSGYRYLSSAEVIKSWCGGAL